MDRKEILMTEGNISGKLIRFSIPLIAGVLLQQLYVMVDSWIVGRFIGSNALAAVGAGSKIVLLLVGFCSGASAGAGVIVAQYFGAKNEKMVFRSVHTAVGLGVAGGVLLMSFGLIGSPWILKALGTPAEIYPDSVMYLRIYFSSMLFIFLYNMAAGILNAVGNSRKTLVYLGIASVVNIILDLLFVLGFNMGIAGAAAATAISQIVSCICSFVHLTRTDAIYHVELRKICLDAALARKMIFVGLPMGMQSVIVCFSNMVIQSFVNSFGVSAIAGYTVYCNVDGFNIQPVLSFSNAVTTFSGQNYGAGKYDRIYQGIRYSLLIGAAYSVVVGILMVAFAPQVMGIFTDNQEVIGLAVQLAHYLCPFYFILTIMHTLNGIVRGTGKALQPMLIVVINLCLVRLLFLFVLMGHSHEFRWICMAYPFSFITGMISMVVYTFITMKKWAASDTDSGVSRSKASDTASPAQ